jgi:hypothetical protein
LDGATALEIATTRTRGPSGAGQGTTSTRTTSGGRAHGERTATLESIASAQGSGPKITATRSATVTANKFAKGGRRCINIILGGGGGNLHVESYEQWQENCYCIGDDGGGIPSGGTKDLDASR